MNSGLVRSIAVSVFVLALISANARAGGPLAL